MTALFLNILTIMLPLLMNSLLTLLLLQFRNKLNLLQITPANSTLTPLTFISSPLSGRTPDMNQVCKVSLMLLIQTKQENKSYATTNSANTHLTLKILTLTGTLKLKKLNDSLNKYANNTKALTNGSRLPTARELTCLIKFGSWLEPLTSKTGLETGKITRLKQAK